MGKLIDKERQDLLDLKLEAATRRFEKEEVLSWVEAVEYLELLLEAFGYKNRYIAYLACPDHIWQTIGGMKGYENFYWMPLSQYPRFKAHFSQNYKKKLEEIRI